MRAETKETAVAWGLGSAGAVAGVARYYVGKPALESMRKPHSANIGWAAIAAGVLAWDLFAPETLSEGVDRALERHKVSTAAAIGFTAAHLANLLPESVDPIHQFGKRARGAIRHA